MSNLQKIVILCVVAGIVVFGGFFLLNNYIYQEKQAEDAEEVVEQAEVMEEAQDEERSQLFSPEEVNAYVGTYGYGNVGEIGGSGILTIRETRPGILFFQLDVNRGPPSYNMGYIEGEIALNEGIATYTTNEYGVCALAFQFEEDKLVVSYINEQDDCGFGGNVHANREYLKTSPEPNDISLWYWKNEGGE